MSPQGLGVAFVTGWQRDDPATSFVTTIVKHHAVHSGPEPLRHGFDAKASAHDVDDTYLVSTARYGITVGGGQPETGAPVVTGTFEIPVSAHSLLTPPGGGAHG